MRDELEMRQASDGESENDEPVISCIDLLANVINTCLNVVFILFSNEKCGRDLAAPELASLLLPPND